MRTGLSAPTFILRLTGPPRDLSWVDLILDASTMGMRLPVDAVGPPPPATASFHTPDGHVSCEWIITKDMDIFGPLALKLPISIAGGGDVSLFVGLRKYGLNGDEAKFEGSFGYASDMVTKGWQRAPTVNSTSRGYAAGMPAQFAERSPR